MFAYSMREKTRANRRLVDDVPQEVKIRRLEEVISTFHSLVSQKNKNEIGKYHLVLVEKNSKRSPSELQGRSDTNKKVIFSKESLISPSLSQLSSKSVTPKIGDYVVVKIDDSTSASLRGVAISLSDVVEFENYKSKLLT